MAVCFSNSTLAGTATHFLQTNCVPVSCPKVRGSFVRKRYFQRIQLDVHDSKKSRSSTVGGQDRHSVGEAVGFPLDAGSVPKSSSPNNPSRAFARASRCHPRKGCRGKFSPPNSSRVHMAQHSYLCCALNAAARDRETKRWKRAFRAVCP